MSADGYDFLCNLAQLDGVRIAPLFLVFWHRDGWAVCGTDIQGDPTFTHQIHKSMRRAYNQAGKLNAENGCGPAITLTAKRAAEAAEMENAMATAINTNMRPIPAARKAEKRLVKLKMAIQGPSGSGKTEGALALATNLWPGAKILLVDTENESASLYADRYDFETIPLDPPFESERYEICIDYAVANGYDVLILDGITPQWDGEGGILRRKEELDRRPGSNSFTNWATFTPEHTHFIEAIKQSQVHTICTMRSKQDYILEQNDKGKSKPVKMGMAPIQRDGFDYEFTLVFDVQMDHKAVAIKNRTGLYGDKPLNLADKKVAGQLKAWLESGKPVEAAATAVAPVLVGKPPQPTNGNGHAKATAAKVDCWKLDADKLNCYVYDAQKKKSKKGSDFVVIKHNGSVNGKDVAFCFQENLFECLLASKGHRAVLFVDLGEYIGIADVIEIDGVEFRDGRPYLPKPEMDGGPITDADLPF